MVAVMMLGGSVSWVSMVWSAALLVLIAGLSGVLRWAAPAFGRRQVVAGAVALVIALVLIASRASAFDIPDWQFCWPWWC